MSRAYRIRIRESLNRVLRAEDHVSTQLDLLEILPAGEMAALLAAELERRGFQRKGAALVRGDGAIQVAVDPASGTVTVRAEAQEQLTLDAKRTGSVVDDRGRKEQREQLRKELRSDLEAQADQRARQLQQLVTDKLERQLADVRAELDKAVNRTIAEALKQRAAQIGTIQNITEDQETGSLSIVVEV